MNVVNYSRRSVPNQFSPKTSEGATKQEYDKPHNRVVLGRNMKHPAARKRAYKRPQRAQNLHHHRLPPASSNAVVGRSCAL